MRSKKARKEPAYEVFDSVDDSDKKFACLPGTQRLISALKGRKRVDELSIRLNFSFDEVLLGYANPFGVDVGGDLVSV